MKNALIMVMPNFEDKKVPSWVPQDVLAFVVQYEGIADIEDKLKEGMASVAAYAKANAT